MPKCFSDEERDRIKKQLCVCAEECMTTYGIAHTTVDDLVKRAHIAKGTFYLFYPSKELLFLDVIINIHNRIQQSFFASLECLSGEITADILTDCIVDTCREVDKTGLMQIMASGELEILMRKLPDEFVAEHLKEDDDVASQLIRMLKKEIHGNRKPFAENDVQLYSSAFRAVFLLMLHKREIGRDFEETLRLIIHGLATQLLDA